MKLFKSQLQKYGKYYRNDYRRMPNKEDKEPIRHLHDYYNACQHEIAVRAKNKAQMQSLRKEKEKLHQLLHSQESLEQHDIRCLAHMVVN
eukprot:scaffold199852_cov49-Cyclotella_meneghiniana.AAC.2